jgi:hypothetical protein
MMCSVLDGTPFAAPLGFRTEGGAYREPGGTRRGCFQRGVRGISIADFASLLEEAGAPVPGELRGPPGPREGGAATPVAGYANSEDARAIETYSRAVVGGWLRSTYGGSVQDMPLNNPRYDLRVEGMPFEYVEVRGTRKAIPWFLMSEGERRFAELNAAAHPIVAVYGKQSGGRDAYGDRLVRPAAGPLADPVDRAPRPRTLGSLRGGAPHA